MLRLLLLFVVLTTLGACTSQGVDENTKQTPSYSAEAERNAQELARHKKRQEALELALERANARVAQLEAGVEHLEQQLAESQRQIVSLRKRSSGADQLRLDIQEAKNSRDAAREQVRQLQESLEEMSEALEFMAEANEIEAAAGEGNETDTPPANATLVTAEAGAQSKEATIVKVFYATNRARMVHTLSDYLLPLWPALALALIYLLSWFCIRKFIKSRYQRPALIGAAAICGAAVAYLLTQATQTILQLRQTEELNPVLYGNSRLQTAAGAQPFELGTCEVSIPPVHERSIVELPKITRFEFRYDPAKHFVLTGVSPTDDAEFYEQLQARVAKSDRHDLFVFVHGFHNTFQDAAFRTAQIAHDLDFPGAPVFFSWPSQGAVLDYAADENNVKIAVFDLQLFLEQLRQRSGAKRIHLIAHSMGSRALSRAVAQMSSEQPDQSLFNEMILAAPDIDAQVLDRLAQNIAPAVDRLTLYASSKDEALSASRFIHGQTYQRAGETTPLPLVNPYIDTIDVSQVTSGHSYIAGSGRILSDLSNILSRSRPLNEHIASKVPVEDGEYWILR